MGNFLCQRLETRRHGDSPVDITRVLMDVTIEKGRPPRQRVALIQPRLVELRRGPILLRAMVYKYQTYILEDFYQGGKYTTSWMRQGESGHGLPRNEGTHVHLDWPQNGKGIEHGRNVDWIPPRVLS